jgi:hypothetical protein
VSLLIYLRAFGSGRSAWQAIDKECLSESLPRIGGSLALLIAFASG